MLSMIDQHWREHLYEMDYLREGINLRAMGQRDPLAEWQREGFDMFEAMMGMIQDNFVRYMFHLDVQVARAGREAPPARRAGLQLQRARGPGAGLGRRCRPRPPLPGEDRGAGRRRDERRAPMPSAVETSAPARRSQPVRVEKTPGRNEPCCCGSGKKFKLCHGR